MQPVEIKETKTQKNRKRAKKLNFTQEYSSFCLKPIIRSQQLKENMHEKPLKEKLPSKPQFSPPKVEPVKKRKGKESVQEKCEVVMLQEQLRDAQNDVIELKFLFEELKEDISKQLDFFNEVAD